MTNTGKKTALIIGATGMQGGAAARALLTAGHLVTAFVRDPSSSPARSLAEQGMTIAVGTMEDTRSLDAAVAGHDVVFSMQMPGVDPADPGAERRQARNIATTAKQAGVTQIIHTSVSATGWRKKHPDIKTDPMMTAYWDEKEAAEQEIRQSGVEHWTIFKPAFYMENYLIEAKRDQQFPDLPQGELITAMGPETALALINADDFGAAVAAAVAEPDKFHEAEIDLAGDALTTAQIANVLSAATGRDITAVHVSRDEQAQRLGAPTADAQIWNDHVGYPARPHNAAKYGLPTTTLQQWAANQTWSS